MQSSVPLTRGTPAAYAPAAPRVAVRSLRTFGFQGTKNMAGNIFASLMIVMVAMGLALVVRTGRRPTIRSSIAGATVAVAALVLLIELIPRHMCRRGGCSATPTFIAVIFAGLATATAPRKVVAAGASLAFLAGAHFLNVWASALVHHSPYVGNPRWPEYVARRTSNTIAMVSSTLKELATNRADALLPEGWLEDSIVVAIGEEVLVRPATFTAASVTHFWHTWMTGIYRIDESVAGMWCHGGSITNVSQILEIRSRTMQSSVPATRGTAAAYAPAAPRVPVR